VTTMSKSLTQH